MKGCFKYSSDRCGYIDECGVKGKESAPYYKKNYARIDAKMRTTTIYKASPPKPVQKQSLSPTSYEPLDSFIKSQRPSPRFYINKGRLNNFVDHAIKNKSWVPGMGKYDHNRGLHIITKGASKGWK